MDTIVHSDKEQTCRRLGDICMPAIQKHRDVMVPVQENKRLLVDHNEECINKLAAFCGGRKEIELSSDDP